MKTLRSLSLAGILGFGLIGSSAYGLEVNEKGFPVPEKAKLEFKGSMGIIPNKPDSNEPDVKRKVEYVLYESSEGNGLIEILVGNRLYGWDVNDNNLVKSHKVRDNNCDGIFESKYSFNEYIKEKIQIPDCYFK